MSRRPTELELRLRTRRARHRPHGRSRTPGVPAVDGRQLARGAAGVRRTARRVASRPASLCETSGVIGFVLLLTGLVAAAYGVWRELRRGAVGARAAGARGRPDADPHRGDPAGAQPDPRPRWSRATSPCRWPGWSWRCTGCTWRPSACRCARDGDGRAGRGGPGPLRGGHRHRDPLPAQDRVQDVLRLLDRVRRRAAQHPRAARSASACPARCPVINRRAVEFVIATGLAIEAQVPERTQWERKNYFYPDLPEGLPDQPVRDPARGPRAPGDRDLGRPVRGEHHPRAPRGGHGQARPRRRRRRPTAGGRRSWTSTGPARR